MPAPEERHLVKIADLDDLERIARAGEDNICISDNFERIFAALDKRAKIDRQKVLEWGQRYLAWIDEHYELEVLPILGTSWAIRMLEIPLPLERKDLALLVSATILDSYAPLKKERRWWQHQFYVLNQETNPNSRLT